MLSGKKVRFVYFEVRIEFGRKRRSMGGSGSPGFWNLFHPMVKSQRGCYGVDEADDWADKLFCVDGPGLLSTVKVFL